MLAYDKQWPQYDLKNNKVRPWIFEAAGSGGLRLLDRVMVARVDLV